MTANAPVLFVSHGAPTVALEPEGFGAALARFARSFPRPAAVVAVSAHWTAGREVGIASAARHRIVHDFGGFPEPLYGLRWPAPGDPALAARAAALLEAKGFRTRLDPLRPLDHGVWIPLRFAWPGAEVPVVQIALPAGDPGETARLGAALAPLRAEGAMVVGSGGLVHNLGLVRFSGREAPEPSPDRWAVEFDAWAAARIEAGDLAALLRWRAEAPHAELAAPTTEHLDPLFVALGARAPGDRVETLYDAIHHGNLAMRSFALRPAGAAGHEPAA